MIYLILVTVLWAFSFSLIGVYLTAVDPWFSVLIRTGLALLVFLPFIQWRHWQIHLHGKLAAIGAIQLGLMYCFYYHSFLYLSVPEVLLFTIMTPIYITLFNDLLDRAFRPKFFISALLAVVGALAIRFDNISTGFLFGLLLVQGANLCFAIGQVSYKRLMKQHQQVAQSSVFGWFFLGAFTLAIISYLLFGNLEKLPTNNTEWGILLYLGIVASGLGYFAWNTGATKVDVGTLAVMNNLLIPAGIIVNLAIWNRDADLGRLALGGSIIVLALLFNSRSGFKSHN